jgi:transketolase
MATNSIADLEHDARRVRATCVQMAFDGRHGHLKSAISCIDLVVALYGRFLNVSAADPSAPDRDRFLFSKGHAITALYATFALHGFIEPQELGSYAATGSRLPDHPCKHSLPLLEISSGSLGHGLGMATGILYGMQMDGKGGRVVTLMSDGECNEGTVWEAAMFAVGHKMNRLLAIVDNNDLQAVGRTSELMGASTIEDKFRGFGWAVRVIDGNAMAQIVDALAAFPFADDRPSVIVAKTKPGAGISFMEDKLVWHYRVPSPEDLQAALSELGVRPIHKGDA